MVINDVVFQYRDAQKYCIIGNKNIAQSHMTGTIRDLARKSAAG